MEAKVMSKISKADAFKEMAKKMDSNMYDVANEIFKIINKSQNNDKKNNIASDYIEIQKKDERLFNKDKIIQ